MARLELGLFDAKVLGTDDRLLEVLGERLDLVPVFPDLLSVKGLFLVVVAHVALQKRFLGLRLRKSLFDLSQGRARLFELQVGGLQRLLRAPDRLFRGAEFGREGFAAFL